MNMKRSQDPGEISLAHKPAREYRVYPALISACGELEAVSAAVAHPCDQSSLTAAVEAAEAELIRPILVGPEAKIRGVAEQCGLDIGPYRLIDAPHSHAAAAAAVEIVRGGEAETLMKGSLHTDELMAAVVSKAAGLRTERRISHVFIMDVPTYPKPLVVTDCAINILPDLATKMDIVQNAIDMMCALGVTLPKVAILSAIETVTPRVPSTIDAAALCKMADRGQITGGLLDGPLAFDVALSKEAAKVKSISSEVAGEPDILLVPDLEAGNILAKQLVLLANADGAGIVLGARVPVILTSRSDTVRARLASCAVAVLLVHARRQAATTLVG
jgi:phosphate acetyltransferase/phosphate butyryltransferase